MEFSFELPQFFTSRLVDPRSGVGVSFVTVPKSYLDRRRGDYPSRFIRELLDNPENDVELVGDLRQAVARLIDLELPSDFASRDFISSEYNRQRQEYAYGLASEILTEAKLVYEESPLAVHDIAQLLSQVQGVASAYSLNLADGPIVLIEHIGNYIITSAALGAATGVKRGISRIIEELFRLKVPRRNPPGRKKKSIVVKQAVKRPPTAGKRKK